MALKKLNQFNYFDAEGFFSKLKLITVGSTVWKEYGSNVVKGTKLEVVWGGRIRTVWVSRFVFVTALLISVESRVLIMIFN